MGEGGVLVVRIDTAPGPSSYGSIGNPFGSRGALHRLTILIVGEALAA
jgi:hypothetical protein